MKKKIFFSVLFLLLASFSASWGSIDHTVSFSKSDLSIFSRDGFSKVKLPKCLSTDELGAPELLVKSVSLLIPRDVKITGVRLVSSEKELITGDYLIYPAQERVPFGETVLFIEPDKRIYESEKPYPDKVVEVAGDGFMNGYHIAGVLVYPLEYIPAKKELYLYTKIVFEVQYESEIRNCVKDRRENFNTLKKKLETVVDNPQAIDKYEPSPAYFKPAMVPGDCFPYVIITTATLSPAFEPLAEWKTKKGIPTKIETLSNILSQCSGNDDAEKIRNFIGSTYTNHNTDWILLGGDVDVIPSRYVWTTMYKGHYILSDFYYCCLEGNWNADGDTFWGEPRVDSVDLYPEVSVGRAPVSDLNAAQVFVNKLFSYEKESPYYDYQTKALFLGSEMFEDSDGVEYCNTLIDYFPGHFYIEGPWYEYDSDTGIVKMNEGYGIIYNISHSQRPGNFLARYNGLDPINDTAIDTLSNADRYSVMLNVTCNNSQLDNNCVGRHFIQNSEGAGVSFIASSRYDYPHASEAMNLEFFDRLFDSEPVTIGEDLNLAKIPLRWRAEGVCAERVLTFSYLLLGDPQMEVWTDTPTVIYQTIDSAAVDTGFHTIEVCVWRGIGDEVEMATVCLSKDDEVYETRRTCPRMGKTVRPKIGSIVCLAPAEFDDIHFPTPGWAHLVASKKNCIPVEDSILVGPPRAPSDLSATATDCQSIYLTWTDNSSTEEGFKIERSVGTPDDFTVRATVLPDRKYYDDGANDETRYWYRVRAYNQVGYSAYSNMDSDSTPKCPPSGPGCPFVFVWNGEEFVEDNNVLAESENSNRLSLDVTDYYLLKKCLVAVNGQYKLQIKEFENEISFLDNLQLIIVDHPAEVRIGVSLDGQIFRYDQLVQPRSCIDDKGIDRLKEIMDEDGIYFESHNKGYLILEFPPVIYPLDYQLFAQGPPGAKSIASSSGFSNHLKLEVLKGETWEEIGNVPPRANFDLFLVDLTPYVDSEKGMKLKLSWENDYRADNIGFYLNKETIKTTSRSFPIAAQHSDSGSVLSALVDEDKRYAILSPEQVIDMAFPSPAHEPGLKRDFVIRVKGHYVLKGSAQEDDLSIPKGFVLYQNYPNPFNVSTGIKFALPEAANVSLNIYNILGQKVASLVNEEKPAGTHTVFWDGRDKSRAEVASGIYFYQLKAGHYKELKKMLLIK